MVQPQCHRRRRRLLSTLVVGACCCFPATSFTPSDTASTSSIHHIPLQHVRFDGLLPVDESSFSSEAPAAVWFANTNVVEGNKRDDVTSYRNGRQLPYEDGDESTGTTSSAASASSSATAASSTALQDLPLQDLPPVLQQITDERRNFQMNLGKAMDTLRKDMPYILKNQPDYSIYHPDITVVDPSGVQLTGLDSYKSSIKFMQQFVKFWFQERSGIQYRMVYDFARSSIRVSWHAVLVPKVPLGKPLHVDGISMYQLDVDSGKIIEHKFEKMMINNTPVMPPYGVFSLLQYEWGMASPPHVGVPAGI